MPHPGGWPVMYEAQFGLHRRPFLYTPDTACYYPATSHERALAQLCRAQADGEGLALLTGPPGTGKTLLCLCLLERLDQNLQRVYLSNSHFASRRDLLQAILFDLRLPHTGGSEQEIRLALTEHFLSNYRNGRTTVLIVDEAQHLSSDLLEELRMLGNLEGRRGKAVQVILVAQPEIRQLLQEPSLAVLRQRLGIHAQIGPLGLHEAADYLVFQIRQAGGRPDALFTDEALNLLARGTAGVPRLLNRAAHHALTLTVSSGAELADAEVVLEALTQLELSVPDEPSHPPASAVATESAVAETTGEALRETNRHRRLFGPPRRSA